MNVFIDADGCPVVDIAVKASKEAGAPCFIVCDTSHVFEKDGAKTITVPRGNDSADFTLVNMIQKGDIAVTQDYGLAAMVMARGAAAVNQNGMVYHDGNIDSLLFQRHNAKKIRRAGGRIKGPPKRTAEQDEEFERVIRRLLGLR
jgi:uncharacterized protein YaiI (UPF0178 family)